MNGRQKILFASLVSAFLVLAAVIGLIIPSLGRGKANIDIDFTPGELGSAGEGGYSENEILANREMMHNVEIKPENLSKLISTLSRPGRYYQRIKSTVISGDRQAVYTSEKWLSGGLVRTVTSDSFGEEYNYLQTSDMVYSWKTGDLSYNMLPRGDFSEDSLVRIPTYESLAEIDPESITDCGTDNIDGYDCVFAVVSYPEAGYVEKYFISIDYGLLIYCETAKDGKLVYTTEVGLLNLEEFEGNPFELPSTSGT